MKYLISIVGPTAAGKTNLSLQLAKMFRSPVISADSRQLYRKMDIGTGKVTEAERGDIPHYFLDMFDPDEECSAGEFGDLVDAKLEALFAERWLLLLVGGSGFYLQAVWEGLNEFPEIPESVRESLIDELDEKGLPELTEELKMVDPETYDRIDLKNPARVIRALEIYRGSGKPISSFRTGLKPKEKSYQDIKIGLTMDRPVLYEKINQRVLKMVEEGLVEEVKGLYETYGPTAKGLQAVGYQEFFPYFEGKRSLEEAISLVQRNSRRLAKRQYTWFRRYDDIFWFEFDDFGGVEAFILKKIGLE